ncbi:hypothetical protein ONS96_013052 [Cadophora gregata f. sp. sojae]|nr:hypothetical protein ONS96_013052 [Cadophora gregata f. sp. sojae]
MAATSGEGSVWTSYTNDDQMFWRELRRELAKEGYRSSTLQRHKRLIKSYVEELGNRGVFDDMIDLDDGPIDAEEDRDHDSIDAEELPQIFEAHSIEVPPHSHSTAHFAGNSACFGSKITGGDTELSAPVPA